MKPEAPSSPIPTDTEPTSGVAFAPVTLLVILVVLCYWGMGFLDRHGGGFNPKVYEPFHSYKEVDDLQPKSDDAKAAIQGKKVYDLYCSVCHQPTGKGLPNQFPPLAESDWVSVAGPDRLIRIVLDGLQGPIKVSGTDWNNAMPPWKELLKDDDIAAVLTYVRQNKAWGNSAGPVTAAQVKAVREKEASRATSWTGDELQQIPLTQ